MRILVVEDKRELARALKKGLEHHGFAVDLAGDADEAWRLAQAFHYEGIVLDRMLPGQDGLELCRQLRAAGSAVGILVLTARDAVDDRVEGLNAGADDYLVKPFDFKELLARVRALVRRHAPQRTNVLLARDVAVDLDAGVATRAGVPLPLSRKEYLLLVYFLRNPGRLLSREQIIESAWDAEAEFNSDVVRAHIKNLRRKLDDGGDRPLIRTVLGMGYKLEE